MAGNNIRAGMVPIVGRLTPAAAVAAAGTSASGYIDASIAPQFIIDAWSGALGGGSVALTLQQATNNAGAGVKAVAGPLLTLAADNTTGQLDFAPLGLLDIAGGFLWFRLLGTVAGGTGAFFTAVCMAADVRYAA